MTTIVRAESKPAYTNTPVPASREKVLELLREIERGRAELGD